MENQAEWMNEWCDLPFTSSILNSIHVKHSSNTTTISTEGQSIMDFRIATTMVHFPTSSSNNSLQSGVSFYCSPLPHTPVKCVSVLVTWEQLSDVWLDKRSWVHAVTAHWCPCSGPTAPCHGSIVYSLSGPLCCEWQWSRLPQEAQRHAGHTI